MWPVPGDFRGRTGWRKTNQQEPERRGVIAAAEDGESAVQFRQRPAPRAALKMIDEEHIAAIYVKGEGCRAERSEGVEQHCPVTADVQPGVERSMNRSAIHSHPRVGRCASETFPDRAQLMPGLRRARWRERWQRTGRRASGIHHHGDGHDQYERCTIRAAIDAANSRDDGTSDCHR